MFDDSTAQPSHPISGSQHAAAKGPSKWGDLDSIGSSPAVPANVEAERSMPDSIPAQASTGKTGLGAMMMGKAKASALTGSGLGQSFHKGGVKPPAPPSFVDGPPIQMDEAAEAAAEAKLKQILASSNPTSDFIFATPGVDFRLLGRIDGWVSQIESKDKHEHGHVRAVAEYATAVSRLLGLSLDDVNTIRLAAIIHDVGKLGLPLVILQKPDEHLSDAELVMTMNHTIDGAKLIQEFPELAALAPIVLAHHEEYDGNGYPEGLSGENIPLGARIIHACNAYTEMVADLKYRAGMPPEQAQSNMIRGSGRTDIEGNFIPGTYDPDVVRALIAAISQGMVPAKII